MVCIGIIVFFVYLQLNIITAFNITINDFSTCKVEGEFIRIYRTQAYNIVVMGLAVAAFVMQFWMAVYLIVISCKTEGYCIKDK